MKKMFVSFFATVMCIAFVIGQAFARPPVYFKAPKINEIKGTGCLQGTMSVQGVNTAKLSITFDGRYDAANPSQKAASNLKRSACSFALPVHVPQGLQVYVITEWSGYSKGKTSLHREYFFPGEKGMTKNTYLHRNFVKQDKWLHKTFSECGRDILMRINSSVGAIDDNAYISMNKMNIKLKWRRCR